MNEIEKMYKNAGIENELQGFHCHRNWDICENEHKCKICKHSELIYSVPFTAEKQLNIVKFLLNKSVYYDTYGDREYWFHLSDKIKNSKYREFSEAIAECINKMWEDLRDYEKQQIKEILDV